MREWLQTLGLSLGALLGLVLLANLGDNLPDFIAVKLPPFQVLWYYLNVIPVSVPAVLPVSFLLSLLLSLGRLHKNSEITAMRAAGMSLFRITRFLWAAGALLSLLMAGLMTSWAPLAREQMTLVEEEILARRTQAASPEAKVSSDIGYGYRAVVYADAVGGQFWFADGLSVVGGKACGLTVHFLDQNSKETARLYAATAEWRLGHWSVRDGRLMKFTEGGNSVWFSRTFTQPSAEADRLRAYLPTAPAREKQATADQLAFQEEVLALSARLTLPPEKLRSDLGTKRASDLTLGQINELLPRLEANASAKLSRYRTRYHSLLATPFLCLILVGLAGPLAVTGVRVNPMIGVGKALAWFCAYFLLNGLITSMGENGAVPPLLAAWLPIVFLVAVTSWLWRRAR